jgi:hypothetical protein
MRTSITPKPVSRQGVKQLSGIIKIILDNFLNKQ